MKNMINMIRMLSTRIAVGMFVVLASTAHAQNNANIRVNRFWGAVNEAGGNNAVSYSGADLNLFADYSVVGARLNGNEGYFAGWTTIACTNWKDPSGTVIPYAVFPPMNKYQPTGTVTTAMKNYVRYASPPDTIVYQGTKTKQPSPGFGTPTAVVSPSSCIGTSDQTVTVTNRYACGVTLSKRILAWSQQFHDNYIVCDLTFTNTSTDTLHGFYVFFQEGPYYISRADGNTPAIVATDQWYNSNTSRKWWHYYGARTTDTLRVYYHYSSDDPEKSGDNIGQPLTQQQGRLFDKDFVFMAALHASKQPYTPTASYATPIDPNDTDDPNQPTVTTVGNLQNTMSLALYTNQWPVSSPDYYNVISGVTLASEDMSGSGIRPGHHRKNFDELGINAPGGQPGISPFSNNFESMVMCFGPYEFGPGKQIRIVKLSGFAGISREKAAEVGQKWLNDLKNGTSTLSDPPGLPNAVTGYFPSNFAFPDGATETDKKKDRWVSTGILELHKTLSRAKWNLLHNYSVPATPAPPTWLNITPTQGGITVSWGASPAESDPRFQGYRVFKKVSTYDTVYYQIAATIAKDAPRSIFDTKVRVSAKTYYYVQAGIKIDANDLNAHPDERGQTIWSGRTWFYNVTGTNSETAPNVSGNRDEIVIVPNPFNYNDPRLGGYNIQNPRNLAVSFFNLPQDVTIRIFTEFGDLVKTIEHHRPSGNETWRMVNENGQAVASGVYIVVFETPGGGGSYQKLVVAR